MEVFLRIGLEALLALRIAEVVGLPLVFVLPCCSSGIDGHPADRVSNTGRDSALAGFAAPSEINPLPDMCCVEGWCPG